MTRGLRAAALAAGVFVAACAAPWVGFWHETGIGDTGTFHLYAQRMVDGRLPFRDFFFDWPPGAIPPVLAPKLLPGATYELWFHLFQLACGAGAVALAAWTLARLGARGAGLWLPVLALGLAPLVLGEISVNAFDQWPALIAAAAVASLVSGRPTLAAALLGLGAATKLYPAVLLPLLLVAAWRRLGRPAAARAAAAFAAVAVAVLAPFAVLGPHGLAYTLRLQLSRGLQFESLGASILMALGHAGLYATHVVVGHPYSLDLAGGAATAVAALSSVAVAALLVLVYVGYAAGPDEPERLAAACAAAVLAVVAFATVLSAQYLLWLVPVVPLVASGRRIPASLLLLLALGLTHVWFPSRFWLLAHAGWVSWVALARNLVLVALALYASAPLAARARSRPTRMA